MAWLDDPDTIRFDSGHEAAIYQRGRRDARDEIIDRLTYECFPGVDGNPVLKAALKWAADVIEGNDLGIEEED